MINASSTSVPVHDSMDGLVRGLSSIFFFVSFTMWLFLDKHPMMRRNAWITMCIGYFLALSVAAVGGKSTEQEKLLGTFGIAVFSVVLFLWAYFMHVDEARRRNAVHARAAEMTQYIPVPTTDVAAV